MNILDLAHDLTAEYLSEDAKAAAIDAAEELLVSSAKSDAVAHLHELPTSKSAAKSAAQDKSNTAEPVHFGEATKSNLAGADAAEGKLRDQPTPDNLQEDDFATKPTTKQETE